MGEPQTWRELLGKIIKEERERQRVADALGVTAVTLTRWVNHETDPRPQNLRKLLQALPQHRAVLLDLLEAEFRGFVEMVRTDSLEQRASGISVEFYTLLLRTLATMPSPLRFASLCDLILLQALKQLDPQRLGLAIIVARCSPPSQGGKIRTLRTSTGRGTPPWEYNLEGAGYAPGSRVADGLRSHRQSTGGASAAP